MYLYSTETYIGKKTLNYYTNRKQTKKNKLGKYLFGLSDLESSVLRKIDAAYYLGREYWNPLYTLNTDMAIYSVG